VPVLAVAALVMAALPAGQEETGLGASVISPT
jgi:hypothetical protein